MANHLMRRHLPPPTRAVWPERHQPTKHFFFVVPVSKGLHYAGQKVSKKGPYPSFSNRFLKKAPLFETPTVQDTVRATALGRSMSAGKTHALQTQGRTAHTGRT